MLYDDPMPRPSRRTELADAAIGTVGAGGLKGLTHRAVDEAAGVPQGTTSNYFRTREQLVDAVAERLAERDLAIYAEFAPAEEELSRVLSALAAYTAHLCRAEPDVVRVRLMLFLDAPSRFAAGHLRFVELVRGVLERAQVPEPERRARALVDHLDGVLLHATTVRPEAVSPEGVKADLTRLVRG